VSVCHRPRPRLISFSLDLMLMIVLPIALLGCETDLYRWNLAHAYVTPQTHISRADFEQIVHVATHATGQTVLQIAAFPPSQAIHREVSVATTDQDLNLVKENGTWRITSKGGIEE
jgi:hypothetical protein